MFTNQYDFHGISVAISADCRELSQALRARLGQFPASHDITAALNLEFSRKTNGAPLRLCKPGGAARSVYGAALPLEALYYSDEDLLFLNHRDEVGGLCHLREGRASISSVSLDPANLWFLSHPMLTLPLVELLKRRGLFGIHAAGLSINGRGILIAGDSGAGKSTLTITLLRAGFGFMGDDMIYLSQSGDGLRLLAFPDEIDVRDGTAQLFPELQGLLRQPKKPGWSKHQLRAETVFGSQTVWNCSPAVLIFPRVAHTASSVLTPIKPAEALMELLPNVLLTDAKSSQAHLDALGELVKASKSFRLETGRDFDAIPKLMKSLID